MREFFIDLNKDVYPGVAILLTLMLALVEIYKRSYSDVEIKNHKAALEGSIDFLSRVETSKIPSYSSKLTISFFDIIFLKPKKYKFLDKEFWNYRVLLFYIIIVTVFNFLFTLMWANNLFAAFFLNYPSIITALDIVKFILLKKVMVYKAKISKDYTGLEKINKRNDFEMIAISSSINMLAVGAIGVSAALIFDVARGADILGTLNHFGLLFLYICLCLISLTVSRVLLYDASKAKSLGSFVSVFFFFSTFLALSVVVSNYLSLGITRNLLAQATTGGVLGNIGIVNKGQYSSNIQWLTLFIIPILLPMVVFLLVFITGLLARVILYPLQKLAIGFLTVIIKHDRYLYVISLVFLIFLVKIKSTYST